VSWWQAMLVGFFSAIGNFWIFCLVEGRKRSRSALRAHKRIDIVYQRIDMLERLVVAQGEQSKTKGDK